MKKIKLYIAASIDGYIARSDGDLDWLTKYPINPETNYGYDVFYKSIDTVIMGGQTYRDILNMDFVWPYTDKTTYVVTRNSMGTKENIHFITENVIENISYLRNENGKDIWLVGGGQLITMLLASDLVDEMIITTIPVILGNGIALFPEQPKESQWELQSSISYKNGVVQAKYKIMEKHL
ncbi:dihydrofolate reductase [Parabacteroides sp. PFB2-10]|uniref:dihydrofolate reductase family protein n=1 Tax=Parabacteroides sp. PFB2-10 TaxID=1742405 RepID=UPI002473F72D|nr:dihydrofolate reductase family protein [Parabacteroides sp. PFB2-10]MDH6314267.1 dihydrofolate reductase [Parabacteroides sp. PFB2-10]